MAAFRCFTIFVLLLAAHLLGRHNQKDHGRAGLGRKIVASGKGSGKKSSGSSKLDKGRKIAGKGSRFGVTPELRSLGVSDKPLGKVPQKFVMGPNADAFWPEGIGLDHYRVLNEIDPDSSTISIDAEEAYMTGNYDPKAVAGRGRLKVNSTADTPSPEQTDKLRNAFEASVLDWNGDIYRMKRKKGG